VLVPSRWAAAAVEVARCLACSNATAAGPVSNSKADTRERTETDLVSACSARATAAATTLTAAAVLRGVDEAAAAAAAAAAAVEDSASVRAIVAAVSASIAARSAAARGTSSAAAAAAASSAQACTSARFTAAASHGPAEFGIQNVRRLAFRSRNEGWRTC
jgi:hypothetical protein